jgi:hypothetical protein
MIEGGRRNIIKLRERERESKKRKSWDDNELTVRVEQYWKTRKSCAACLTVTQTT